MLGQQGDVLLVFAWVGWICPVLVLHQVEDDASDGQGLLGLAVFAIGMHLQTESDAHSYGQADSCSSQILFWCAGKSAQAYIAPVPLSTVHEQRQDLRGVRSPQDGP